MLFPVLCCALYLTACTAKSPTDSTNPFELEAVETAEKYSDLIGESFDMAAVLDRLQAEGYTAVDIRNDYGVANADSVRKIFPHVSELPAVTSSLDYAVTVSRHSVARQ